MSTGKTQRLRDPVHGLIVFRADSPRDELAWSLLDTPEFQRLRRIKQLGVSEFVFPSATHTRLAHSIGVFHTARGLVDVIGRVQTIDHNRADVAVVAALLHDLGHGPFSHTFEGVQRGRGVAKKHERWTAEIIRNPDGGVRPLLEAYGRLKGFDFCEQVASLLEAEDPIDVYHAIVSSSLDADRLDYLRRDRLMTGTGAGAIDFDWLMEHVRVEKVAIEAPDGEGDGDNLIRVPTFCLDAKALPAAEQFLIARYALHEQVYFHKATRCLERMIGKLLGRVAEVADSNNAEKLTGLGGSHPIRRFFASEGGTLPNYLALDDVVVMGALPSMETADDKAISELASRIRYRRLYKTLDMAFFGQDAGSQLMAARRIDRMFAEKLRVGSVLKDDTAAVSIYTQIGGDDDRTHKKLHILDAKGPKEITEFSKTIRDLAERKKQFTRYYFEDEADRDAARNKKGPSHD